MSDDPDFAMLTGDRHAIERTADTFGIQESFQYDDSREEHVDSPFFSSSCSEGFYGSNLDYSFTRPLSPELFPSLEDDTTKRIEEQAGSHSSRMDKLRKLLEEGKLRESEEILRDTTLTEFRAFEDDLLHSCAAIAARRRGLLDKLQIMFDIMRVQPSLRLKDGSTLLHEAVRNANVKGVELLLSYLVNASAKNNDGETALHIAASIGQEGLVAQLSKHCDVNAENNLGDTAVHLAVEEGHISTVVALAHAGANLTKKNRNGLDVATLAEIGGFNAEAEAFRKMAPGLDTMLSSQQNLLSSARIHEQNWNRLPPRAQRSEASLVALSPTPAQSQGLHFVPNNLQNSAQSVRLLATKRRRESSHDVDQEKESIRKKFFDSLPGHTSREISTRLSSVPLRTGYSGALQSAPPLSLSQRSVVGHLLAQDRQRDSAANLSPNFHEETQVGVRRPVVHSAQPSSAPRSASAIMKSSSSTGNARRLPAEAVRILEDWVKEWRVGEGSHELPVERGWTKQLAEKTNLQPHQVKDWVRRFRSRKLKETMRLNGVEPSFRKRLSTQTLNSQMERVMTEVAERVAAKKNEEIRGLIESLQEGGRIQETSVGDGASDSTERSFHLSTRESLPEKFVGTPTSLAFLST